MYRDCLSSWFSLHHPEPSEERFRTSARGAQLRRAASNSTQIFAPPEPWAGEIVYKGNTEVSLSFHHQLVMNSTPVNDVSVLCIMISSRDDWQSLTRTERRSDPTPPNAFQADLNAQQDDVAANLDKIETALESPRISQIADSAPRVDTAALKYTGPTARSLILAKDDFALTHPYRNSKMYYHISAKIVI